VAELAAAPDLPALLVVTSRPARRRRLRPGWPPGPWPGWPARPAPCASTSVARHAPPAGLTAREIDVLACLAAGMSNKQVAVPWAYPREP
jgi:hypothetical protein